MYHKLLLDGTITNATAPNVARIELEGLSNQSKVMCLTDSGVVQRVEYILADYEPITFLQPAINNTELPYQDSYSIPCSVTGHPQPKLSWLSIDDTYNTQTELQTQWPIEVVEGPASLTLRYTEYLGFIHYGTFACRANNVWESSLQVLYLPLAQHPVTQPPGEYSSKYKHKNITICLPNKLIFCGT